MEKIYQDIDLIAAAECEPLEMEILRLMHEEQFRRAGFRGRPPVNRLARLRLNADVGQIHHHIAFDEIVLNDDARGLPALGADLPEGGGEGRGGIGGAKTIDAENGRFVVLAPARLRLFAEYPGNYPTGHDHPDNAQRGDADDPTQTAGRYAWGQSAHALGRRGRPAPRGAWRCITARTRGA